MDTCSRYIGICRLCIMLFIASYAGASTYAAPNPIKRYEIDAKRTGVEAKTEEGLAASRAFIRIDSTYYVGWMYQGMYQSDRAADFLGYKIAISPLEKSLSLLEKDYAKELKVRTNDAASYYSIIRFQKDYDDIAQELFNAYQNTGADEQCYLLLRRMIAWNMQKYWTLNPYNMLAWITHRNRFYTSKDLPFLKNSIAENEHLSQQYLDTALANIAQNQLLNQNIFPEFYNQFDQLSVYHYKCILFAYNFQIDSADHYFELLEGTSMFPFNNHGTYLATQALFKEALEEYEIAGSFDPGDKRLQEWAYYSSIMNIYKGLPLKAALDMRSMIKSVGSTPGFGWYNIALARACTYEGDLADSKKYIDRAANFKEVHIGTTLGQTHYEFSINLVRLLNTEKSIQALKFEDKNWWWKPSKWWALSKRKSEKYAQQYLITNQLAANPEREQVVYKIFSTESTVSFDEVWYLIKDFSTNFFYKKFENELKTDKRERVWKYYNLFLAKLEIEKGNYDAAQARLEKILAFKEDIEPENERLFLARVFESLAVCADEHGDDIAFKQYAAKMYSVFPQLLPYATFKPQMKLEIQGENKKVLNALKAYRIHFTDDDVYAPTAHLVFSKEKGKDIVLYSVKDFMGNTIVSSNKIAIETLDEAVQRLAYGLFNITSLDTQADIQEAN